MSAIRITVHKEANGFTFSIPSSVCAFIKTLFPGARPATTLTLSYDSAGDFDILQSGIEKYICPTLTGVDKNQFKRQIDKIEFVNSETGKIQKVITLV